LIGHSIFVGWTRSLKAKFRVDTPGLRLQTTLGPSAAITES